MPDAIPYDSLVDGRARIETNLQLEQLAETDNGIVVLCGIGVGNFGKSLARLIVHNPDPELSIGFRSVDGVLESALTIRSGEVVNLAMTRKDLLRRFDQSTHEIDIEAELKRHLGSTEPPARLVRLRVRLVSSTPPDIVIERIDPVAVEADKVDALDGPVLFSRLRIKNAPRQAPYQGPAVTLALRVINDNLASDLVPITQALLVRRIEEGTGTGTGAWISVEESPPFPLPFQDRVEPVVLECGVSAHVLQTWLRAGGPRTANPTINFKLEITSTPDNAQVKSHLVQLPLQVRGAPADVLFLKIGNESFRAILRPHGPVPNRLLETRLRTSPREAVSGIELGLEPLVFEVTIMSNEPAWTLKPEARLTDYDAEKHSVEFLDHEILLVGVPRAVQIPLPSLATKLTTDGCRLEHAMLTICFRLHRGRTINQPPSDFPATPDDHEVRVELAVTVDRALPAWLVCVDFGASAIAVGIAPGRTGNQVSGRIGPLAVLPLGDWFKIVDPLHPEIARAQDRMSTARGAQDAMAGVSVLIPSYVGLSSAINLRARFDPASYGNLEAMLDESDFQRLDLLGREYDLSMPYPSNERLSDEFGKVIFALKRYLAKGTAQVRIFVAVHALRSRVLESTNKIGVAQLFANCFHELGSYLVPRVLHHATRHGAPGPSDQLKAFRVDVETGASDGVAVVLTHPFGLDARQLTVYREAGRCFLAGLMGCSSRDPALGKVVCVPEALAAARYGLFRLLEHPTKIGRSQRIICLDIGASTYDVTIIDAETRKGRPSQPVPSWKILGHFGLLLGGSDLDSAIAQRVIEIVEAAADMPAITTQFFVERNLKTAASQIDAGDDRVLRRKQRNFLEAVQKAKKDLAESLFNIKGPYQWGSERLVVDIGTAVKPGSNGDDMPFACLLPDRIPKKGEPPVTIKIADPPANLVYGRDASGTPFVTLQIGPEVFASRPARLLAGLPRVDDPDVLTEILARRIPELAAASASETKGGVADSPICWIVTGRAALWPPIYSGIADIVQKSGGFILEKPFRADEMKKAVLEGALRLAVETHLPLTTTTPPTIGVVTHEDDVPKFKPLSTEDPLKLSTGVQRELVRMLPGLATIANADIANAENLCLAFEAAGLEPWSVLEPDIDYPGYQMIDIALVRTEQGIMVTVKPDGAPADKIRKYGPFREDRIYGHSDY